MRVPTTDSVIANIEKGPAYVAGAEDDEDNVFGTDLEKVLATAAHEVYPAKEQTMSAAAQGLESEKKKAEELLDSMKLQGQVDRIIHGDDGSKRTFVGMEDSFARRTEHLAHVPTVVDKGMTGRSQAVTSPGRQPKRAVRRAKGPSATQLAETGLALKRSAAIQALEQTELTLKTLERSEAKTRHLKDAARKEAAQLRQDAAQDQLQAEAEERIAEKDTNALAKAEQERDAALRKERQQQAEIARLQPEEVVFAEAHSRASLPEKLSDADILAKAAASASNALADSVVAPAGAPLKVVSKQVSLLAQLHKANVMTKTAVAAAKKANHTPKAPMAQPTRLHTMPMAALRTKLQRDTAKLQRSKAKAKQLEALLATQAKGDQVVPTPPMSAKHPKHGDADELVPTPPMVVKHKKTFNGYSYKGSKADPAADDVDESNTTVKVADGKIVIQKKQPKKQSTFEEMEHMGDFQDKSDDDTEDSDADRREQMSDKFEEESSDAGDNEEDEVNADMEDAEDGQSIQGFLRREAKALKKSGKKPQTVNRVLQDEVALQGAPIQIKTVTVHDSQPAGSLSTRHSSFGAVSEPRTAKPGSKVASKLFHRLLDGPRAKKAVDVVAQNGGGLQDPLAKQLAEAAQAGESNGGGETGYGSETNTFSKQLADIHATEESDGNQTPTKAQSENSEQVHGILKTLEGLGGDDDDDFD